jgi:hypothetical protein
MPAKRKKTLRTSCKKMEIFCFHKPTGFNTAKDKEQNNDGGGDVKNYIKLHLSDYTCSELGND